MRKLFVLLLIAAAGCATAPRTEPPLPELVPLLEDFKEPGPITSMEQAGPRTVVPETTAKPAPTARAEVAPIPSAPAPAAPARIPDVSPPQRAEQPAPTRRAVTQVPEHPVADRNVQGLVALAARNDEKIMQVHVGMYQKTVKTIMADARNPYRRQTITGADGRVYEVAFYLTREPRKGKPISDRMLTPVIFREGKVIAIGAYQYKKLQRTGSLGRQKQEGTALRAAS